MNIDFIDTRWDVSSTTALMPDEKQDFFRHRWWDYKSWSMAYHCGYREGNYPVPAIPLRVVWPSDETKSGYKDMIYIDDVSDPDDPLMVCAWDFWPGPERIGNYGEYTRT